MAAPLPMFFAWSQPDPAEFLEVLAGFQVVLKTADGFGGIVRRAIVYDDYFDLLQARRFVEHGQPIQAGFDQILFVVGRHDDGESGARAIFAGCSGGGEGRVAGNPSAHWRLRFCFWPAAGSSILSSKSSLT